VDDVLSGQQVACKWVRLACERHRRDLENGTERGLRFDETTAKTAIAFFRLLKHSKGEWAGRPLALEPWEQFAGWSLFGWKREDGTRRFRTSYLEVARKNGKTTLAAGVGLYLMLADGEPGAEVYSVATKRDQARISHSEATRMAKSSPQLRRMVTIFKDNIHIVDTASKFEPLGADSDTMDGLNVHGAIVDEVHAHKTRDTWDVIETATGSRRQPLMFAITTSGYDRQSLLSSTSTQKVLGRLQDDSWFGIDTLDHCRMEQNLNRDNDERSVDQSEPEPGRVEKWTTCGARPRAQRCRQRSTPLRLELDIWTQANKWINLALAPVRQTVDAEGLRGRTCYAGLDLSSSGISAWCWSFRLETRMRTKLCRSGSRRRRWSSGRGGTECPTRPGCGRGTSPRRRGRD
jgi:phage terminase large subunit-like protein